MSKTLRASPIRKRDRIVSVAITRDEYHALVKASTKARLTGSSYMRAALNEKVERDQA